MTEEKEFVGKACFKKTLEYYEISSNTCPYCGHLAEGVVGDSITCHCAVNDEWYDEWYSCDFCQAKWRQKVREVIVDIERIEGDKE